MTEEDLLQAFEDGRYFERLAGIPDDHKHLPFTADSFDPRNYYARPDGSSYLIHRITLVVEERSAPRDQRDLQK